MLRVVGKNVEKRIAPRFVSIKSRSIGLMRNSRRKRLCWEENGGIGRDGLESLRQL